MEIKTRSMSQKKKTRIVLEYVYKFVMCCFEAITFTIVWTQFYTPLNIYRTNEVLKVLFMAMVYTTTYHIFAKFYKAYRLGTYRTTELMYFHFLAMGITNMLFFLEGSIYKHRILNIVPIIMMYLFQWGVTTIITLQFNRVIGKMCERREVVIVYGDETSIELQEKMNRHPRKFHICDIISQDTPFDEITDSIDKCTAVYLCEVKADIADKLVLYCTINAIDIYLTRGVSDLIMMGYEFSHSFDTPFIRRKKETVKIYYPFAKRTLDIACSLAGLIIMSPILLIVATAIKLYDRGPVFYTQTRLTKNHKIFKIYKFRSMIVNAERDGKARLAAQGDNRITPIGKIIRATRIDEFPQLINVLKGDMSIVGPRPERPEIEKEYLEVIPEFGLRLQVKAGLTGYAQVFGKYNTTPIDKLKLDLLYINQQSFWMDVKIILWTIKILFIPESTEGVQQGEVTAIKKSE